MSAHAERDTDAERRQVLENAKSSGVLSGSAKLEDLILSRPCGPAGLGAGQH
jgi:hypothetical protein